jgi:hypothetical protein
VPATTEAKRPARVLIIALVAMGCGLGSTDCCVDGEVSGLVEAFVVDAQFDPVAGASVEARGRAPPCESIGDGSRVAGSGFTDATGWLRLHVHAFLSSPGLYCVELIVAGSGVAAPDTLRGLEVPMTRGTPTDTIRVIRRVDA